MLNVEVNFILAPTNRYVGWIIYNNAHWFGSGETLSLMYHNIRQKMWKEYGTESMPKLKFRIAPAPTKPEDVPIQFMSERFLQRAYYGGKKKPRAYRKVEPTPIYNTMTANDFARGVLPKEQHVEPVAEPVETKTTCKPDATEYDYYDQQVIDGVLHVYGIKRVEVATFKLKTTEA